MWNVPVIGALISGPYVVVFMVVVESWGLVVAVVVILLYLLSTLCCMLWFEIFASVTIGFSFCFANVDTLLFKISAFLISCGLSLIPVVLFANS